MNTHTEQRAAIYAVGWSSWGSVPQRAIAHTVSLYGIKIIEVGESAVHSLPPPTIPADPRLKLATFQLQVRLSNH